MTRSMRALLGLAAAAFWMLVPTASIAAPAARCVAARAEPASIEAIRSDYPAWRGRCVRLRGIQHGRRLYVDRRALIEPFPGYGEQVRRSIFLYGLGRRRDTSRPKRVEVIGTLGSCGDQNAALAAMQADRPDEILMLSGYCHTSLEDYIEPVARRVLSSAPIPRLIEAEVPAGDRALVDAPADTPDLAVHRDAARALVAAVVAGDEAAYRRLRRPEVQDEVDKLGGKPAPAWLRAELREGHAQFIASAALRKDLAAVRRLATPERVMLDRDELEASREAGNGPPGIFTICWCRTADCAGRWPVAASDADNGPARPYVCARTNDYMRGPSAGTALQVVMDVAPNGFAEPAWPAVEPPSG